MTRMMTSSEPMTSRRSVDGVSRGGAGGRVPGMDCAGGGAGAAAAGAVRPVSARCRPAARPAVLAARARPWLLDLSLAPPSLTSDIPPQPILSARSLIGSMGSSVVVADKGALDGRADLPVEPDGGVEGEQALYHASPPAGRDAAAVPFQPELVLEVGERSTGELKLTRIPRTRWPVRCGRRACRQGRNGRATRRSTSPGGMTMLEAWPSSARSSH
jgi:hypothetical protein